MLLAAAAVLLFSSAWAAEAVEDDGVQEWVTPAPTPKPSKPAAPHMVELDAFSFHDEIDNTEAVLVEFYAPWCTKCKTLRKEYERAAVLAHEMQLPVTLARMDANQETVLAKELGVKNLPTFLLYRNSSAEVFPMLTTAEAIVAGLDKLLGLGKEVSPVKDFQGGPLELAEWLFWRGTDDGKIMTTAVLYKPEGASAGDLAVAESALAGVADELMRFSNLRFAKCSTPETLGTFELAVDKPTLVLYKDHDEGRAVYSGEWTTASLRDFILKQDTPLVVDIWHRTLQSFRKRVPQLSLFFLNGGQYEHPPTMQRVKERLQSIAFALETEGLVQRGQFTIGIADGSKYSSWLSHLGLPAGVLPALALEDTQSGKTQAAPDFSIAAADRGSMPAEEARMYAPARQVQEEEEENEEVAAASIDAQGQAKVVPSFEEGFSHKMPEEVSTLTWVDVPVEQLLQWYRSILTEQPAATSV